MKANILTSMTSGTAKLMHSNVSDGVVEIGLLLPSNRAAELLQLARDRHESVGQVLRRLIEVELARSA